MDTATISTSTRPRAPGAAAAIAAAAGFLGIAAFQVALAAGAPLGQAAWGGAHDGQLPTSLRVLPIHPRVLDYYFGLVPELDTPEARSRFFSISLVDGRTEQLARKLVARPGAIRRIRELIGDPELAIIVPFAMTEHEVELAVRLGVPVYGCDPSLAWLGTKQGGRQVFADEDVPHPVGFEIDGGIDVL